MKKIFAFVGAVALLASCTSKENATIEPIVPEVELVPITVTAGVDTKATIDQMKWEAGDKITVWVESDIESNPTFQGYELEILDIETGAFYGEIAAPQDNDTFYAAYGATGFDRTNRTPVFAIPAQQNDAAAGATKVMLGGKFTGSRDAINFVMTAATAKLSITVSEDVKAVEFAGMNDEIIAQDGAKVISYNGAAANDVQLIVPAINFSKGYKVTYTNTADQKMYQSYSSTGVTFEAGKSRAINCTFVPFSISCAIDAANAPKTSYDYYLAGNIERANSADFETVGRLSGGATEQPYVYDEDAQGIFTGKIEKGKANIVINGASSKVIPSNLRIKEYGCYVKRVGGQLGKDVYAEDQSIALTKDFSWDVMYKVGESAMIEVDAGDLELKPYIIVNDGTSDQECVAPTAYTIHVTGLPHRSDHKDLWYVCTTGSGADKVSGRVDRKDDETDFPVDVFHQTNRSGWEDYCVRTRPFNIPAATYAQVIMHGTLWAPYSINAYFWFDETMDTFKMHKDVDKSGANGEKLANLSDCDAYEELSQARQNKAYYDLGTNGTSAVNNNKVTLSSENPAVSVYLWIYRGSILALDYVGYWCRYVKVQYAAAQNN